MNYNQNDDVITIKRDTKKTKRIFVLEYLLQTDSEYVTALYNKWCEYRQQIDGKKKGTNDSFRVLINQMKQEGELELDHVEDIQRGFKRHYYRIPKKYKMMIMAEQTAKQLQQKRR